MEEQHENQTQAAKKPNTGVLIIIGIAAAVIIAIIIIVVIALSNKGPEPVQPPADMGELIDVHPANLYGMWDKELDSGTIGQLDFKMDKTLVYREMDKDENVLARSEIGAYDNQDGKLILTLSFDGKAYYEVCTVYLSYRYLVISADEGTGFFNGVYEPYAEISDELYDYFNSQNETEAATDAELPEFDPSDYTLPETEAPATEPPATEPPATEPPATEPPATEPPATEPPATEPPATEPPATEPPATEAPATEAPDSQAQVQEEPHIPEAIGSLFLQDAYTYFNGNVPGVDDDAMGWASFNVREDHMSLKVNYARDYTQEKVTPTGRPVEIIAYVEDLFPQLENTSYDALEALLGDSISCVYHEMTGSYYITAELDGFDLTFDGGETVSLDEIETCSIRLPDHV